MKSKKNIVMLGTSFDAWGGIASVVNAYREDGLFERRAIIYIATHCNGTTPQKFRLFMYSWFSYLAMLLQGNVILAHVHTAADASFWRKTLFIFPGFLLRVPTVLHIHAGGFPDFYEHRCSVLARSIVRYVCDRADCVIVVSAALKHWTESISKNQQIVTIYNPVHVPVLVDATLRTQAQVLFLGRLEKGKGIYDLLHAIRQIVGRHPNIKLILGGDGDLERTRAAIHQLGIAAYVELPGWVSGPAKALLLAQAAVYVLPSYAEGLPMSLLEAMSAGLAVIATPVGGIPEAITDGVEGCLVPPGDVDKLSATLDTLLSDKGLRHRMGAAGRTKAEIVFSSKHIIPLIEELYRQLGAIASDDVAAT
jgi:glycosyltransferase involved in cell wall biosynthesis